MQSPQRPTPTRDLRWLIIPATVAAVFGGMFLLWALGLRDAYFGAIDLFGIRHHKFPFLDGRAVLSWVECARMGLDVFVDNPCGEPPINPASYPPVWKLLEPTGLTRDGAAWLGWGFLSLFVLSLAGLPAPRDGKELAVRLLASLSPAVAYALERANIDALVFSVAVGGCVLLLRAGPAWRWLAWPLILLISALKLYPVALLGLVARDGLRASLALAGVTLAGAVLFWLAWHRELAIVLALVPGDFPFAEQWGAPNLAMGLAMLGPRWFVAMPWLRPAITAGLLLVVLAGMTVLLLRTPLRAILRAMPADTEIMAMAGGILVAGCFVAGMNGAYRGVHVLLLLPALCALARGAAPGTTGHNAAPGWLRLLARLAIAAALFGMWSEWGRNALGMIAGKDLTPTQMAFWLAREAAWWTVFAAAATLAAGTTLNALARWPGLSVLASRAVVPVRPPASPPARP